MRLFLDLLALVRALSADRTRLGLENVLLRQQLNVLRRSVKRARINDGDRMFWVLMHRLFTEWKEHLVAVKPETAVPRAARRGADVSSRIPRRSARRVGGRIRQRQDRPQHWTLGR